MNTPRRLTCLSTLLLSFMLAGCGTLSNVAPEAEVPQKAQRVCGGTVNRNIESWLPAMVEQQSPAMVVGVIDGRNQRHFWHFGVTDAGRRTPTSCR